ncbi:ABC transporter permease [Desertimonas flava]|jgi:peptide/nickel transport system permease protein|uniref:ABC transporter permease n=1 Tax=Desertimonas flava TaxID=2064846 RepID=UPI000E342054|nr:ABC transporter permease [Desertimonas flava]
MLRLTLRRLAALIPLLFIVTVVVWGLLLLIPGDPAQSLVGDSATPEQLAAVREELGLNDPAYERYGRWLGGVVRGDLGTSLFTSYQVTDAITDRLPVTLSLVACSFVLATILGMTAGVVAATHRGRWLDRLLTVGTSVGVAVPNFWLGLVLVTFFAMKLDLFPAGDYVGLTESPLGWLHHITLPAVTLALAAAAEIARQMRASMVDVLERDYVRTHRARGMPERAVVGRYALKNAAMPVVTVAGLQVARLFGLSTIIEQIFNMQGVGQLAVDSVFKRDVPMIQGVVLTITVVVVLTNLVVDVSYGLLNPKVRES